MQVTTIGVDLAKNVFQVHGITANEEQVFNRPLRRAQFLPFFGKLEPCLIGMESCSSLRREEHRVSKTREMMVHKSAAKTETLRRMARASQPAKLIGAWFAEPIRANGQSRANRPDT